MSQELHVSLAAFRFACAEEQKKKWLNVLCPKTMRAAAKAAGWGVVATFERI